MLRSTFVLALASLATALPAHAQNVRFPRRPVTLTVGFAPGGGADLAARIVAKKLAENIGQAVVVENRPGAGGIIAANQIAAAAPDGYTISLSPVGVLAVAPALYKDLKYDPKRDIAPITMGMMVPGLIVVNAKTPLRTMADFVALAKARPGQVTYASPGVGGLAHLWGELLKQQAGINIVHVPYKGAGPAMNDLLAGRVSTYVSTAAAALPYIQAGRLRAIAVQGHTHNPMLPDVPTMAECGYPGVEEENWYAFVAPANTPNEILDFWNRELVRALDDPAVKAELIRHDLVPQPGTREAFARSLEAETRKWARVVSEAHIELD